MEAKAQARYVRVTPQKARRVVDLIRGKQASESVAVLQFAPQAASEPVRKVLQSAIANARVKADAASQAFDERELVITEAYVDEGPTLKRFRPRAQGRASRINKRTSHITVAVLLPEPRASGRPRRPRQARPPPASRRPRRPRRPPTQEGRRGSRAEKPTAKKRREEVDREVQAASKTQKAEASKGSAQ